ncbi:pyrroloquinoline quinone biosynthesis protein PqqB [Actinokineospora sp. NBRC 105648]|uniref:pyrroloquinoline quinone biosynthesis protein PqqB n=1 Tax=Actinokineospora sp. NBRC 105648 TaxID=3032206 RepID=UPI0024A0CB5A|nr:pyrroloquinoline quinone biosynthesis protein PqqB [Actinokineospora sp. NBRC 105648]GLZ43756.1 coenzyme PQQ synthesis protein B [Actinokineospora sp. NBRC 105648]
MKVIVLGTAAGGGLPQWNCACELCTRCRRGELAPRTQDCVAVSATGRDWFLLNAAPDLRAQLTATAELAPGPARRQTPLRGVLLTDAEIDHTLGLALLREGAGLTVWAPAPVLGALSTALPLREVIGQYHDWAWRVAAPAFTLDDGRLECAVFPLSGKRPRYAQAQPSAPDWVVAYRIRDPATGGVLAYAPCLATWPPGFSEFVADADCTLLDGTFHTAGEMSHVTASATNEQRRMGHIPITESLPLLNGGTTRWCYTHLNNTNPVADPASPQHRAVTTHGTHIPADGARFTL